MITGFIVAVVAHLFVLLALRPILIEAAGTMGRASEAAASTLPPDTVTALDPSCDADAMLRAVARAVLCATPFVEDANLCLDDVAERLRIDEMLCHIDQMDVVPATALLDKRSLEDVPMIDAEPLLEPMTPEEEQQYEQQLQQVAMAPPPPPPQARPQDAQVIENTKPSTDEAPEDARFLAEYDSKVDKQTVARGAREDEMVERPDPAESVPSKQDVKKEASQPENEDPPGKSPDAPPNPGILSMRRPGAPAPAEVAQDKHTKGDVGGSDAPVGDGTKGQRGDGSIEQDQRKPSETNGNDGGGGGGKPKAPNLRPDDETLERIVGGGSVDHVEEVDEGEETAYNAKRWVYASFFNRMKRQVAQNWEPAAVWHREDPDGAHHGFKDRVTQLRVSLDKRGGVVKILITAPCGVDALDDEAIRAFEAAQPFPNPPEALVDSDGKITFEFGFYFTIGDGSRTSWKVYRGQ